jgi:formamidopyrimidine-DNA glycosylase
MPELPEVETIRADLEKNVLNRQIIGSEFLWPGILKDAGSSEFESIVLGKKITAVERRAKNLSLHLDGDYALLFHMKMTGHLIFTDDVWQVDESGRWQRHEGQESPLYDPLNQYIRAVFYLSGEKILAFSDLRKFAYVRLIKKSELANYYDKYGPEPLEDGFTADYLEKALATKSIAIKKALLDQTLVAGIGNIYADEILFLAKIHPLTPANKISREKLGLVVRSTKKILTKAIELRGTSTSDFRDTEGKKGEFGNILAVYRRTGQPCINDGTPIARIVVGGRGTHYCPKEQVLND